MAYGARVAPRHMPSGKPGKPALRPATFAGPPHLHRTTFQLVYVLRGWIEFQYEGEGIVRLDAGSCVHQPPSIRHREVAHSDDVEMLEIVMPAGFATEEVAAVDEHGAARRE